MGVVRGSIPRESIFLSYFISLFLLNSQLPPFFFFFLPFSFSSFVVQLWDRSCGTAIYSALVSQPWSNHAPVRMLQIYNPETVCRVHTPTINIQLHLNDAVPARTKHRETPRYDTYEILQLNKHNPRHMSRKAIGKHESHAHTNRIIPHHESTIQ